MPPSGVGFLGYFGISWDNLGFRLYVCFWRNGEERQGKG